MKLGATQISPNHNSNEKNLKNNKITLKSQFIHIVFRNKKKFISTPCFKAILSDSNWVLMFLSKLLPYAAGSVYLDFNFLYRNTLLL